jgi:hypothetical protein
MSRRVSVPLDAVLLGFVERAASITVAPALMTMRTRCSAACS